MKTIFSGYSLKITYLLTLLFFASLSVNAQVGIGVTSPDVNAQLEVKSSNKGILIPRIDRDHRNGINAPAQGLLIYQTDNTPGFYYYDGGWKRISTDSAPPAIVGFSAEKNSGSYTTSATLTGYSTTNPLYTGTGFNALTGLYTVPETGKYAVTATINYQLATASTVSLGSDVNPTFQLKRTSPVVATLLSGYLPILNVNVALVLTLRTVLANSTVTLSGNVALTAGDVVELAYDANGLTQTINIGGSTTPGIVWSVTKL